MTASRRTVGSKLPAAPGRLQRRTSEAITDASGNEYRIVTRASPRQHVVVWIVGSVVASLVPFLFLSFHSIDGKHTPDLYSMLGRGDLLLIALVITIGGIAEILLVLNQVEDLMAGALLLLGGILLVVAEAFWYADLTSQVLAGQETASQTVVTWGSLILFATSAACSAACVLNAARSR